MRSVTRSNVVSTKDSRATVPPFGLPKRQKNNRDTSRDQRGIPMFRYLSYDFPSSRIFSCAVRGTGNQRLSLRLERIGSRAKGKYTCFLISYLSEDRFEVNADRLVYRRACKSSRKAL